MPKPISILKQIDKHREIINSLQQSVNALTNKLNSAKKRKDAEIVKVEQYDIQILIKKNFILSRKKTIKDLEKLRVKIV